MTNPEVVTTVLPVDVAPYIDRWDEYWLEMALTAGRKSKDPKCRVGAVIVRDEQILSTGFNGFARQVFDDPKLLSNTDEKLRLICHAEQNAIHNAARVGIALQGATIYVTKFPCLACCNAIIQAGIARIYTHDDSFWGDDPADGDHSRKKSTLRQAKIKVDAPFHSEYTPQQPITGKRRPRSSAVPQQPSAKSTGAALTPEQTSSIPARLSSVPPARKKRKGAKPAVPSMSLFGPNRSLPGGR